MPAEKSRRNFLIVVGTLVTVLAVVNFSQMSLNMPFLLPAGSETTILLFVLSVLLSLAFIVFAFMLSRNVLKLYIERRARVLGSKFKFKLVAGALALSLLPVMFLFYSSYVLMNRTMDKWFKLPFDQIIKDTRDIVDYLSNYASQKTEADAQSAAAVLLRSSPRLLPDIDEQSIARAAKLHGVDYLVWIGPEGKPRVRFPAAGADLLALLPPEDQTPSRPVRRVFFADGAEFAFAVVPLRGGAGWLMAGNRLPPGLSDRMVAMQRQAGTYEELKGAHKNLRRILVVALALVTVIILFITTWMALFLSKQVTVPIQSLAAATLEVSQGRFDHRVETRAVDELAVLVERFNQMTEQLAAQRQQLESANRGLEAANVQLDQRTRFTEAILESIPTGVISLSPRREILRINAAVERLLGTERARAARELSDLFAAEELRQLDHLLRRSVRVGTVTSQFELAAQGQARTVAITAASLPHPLSPGGRFQNLGYILVIEDLSDVIHAQQEAAWREVAKRIAHEIKNPLTPIALSAERIRRHLERSSGSAAGALPGDSLQVVDECATLIEREVATLENLVNEFSQLARFPKVQPIVCNLNGVVENALAVFNGRLGEIAFRLDLCPSLPQVQVDPDQFKRVIVNLVDNAAEAMENSIVKELRVSTSDLRGEAVELCVADTGPGIDAEIKEKLFLPYFSTKERGTGLGLAIVSRIVNEHHGSIRVEENQPVGARFIVELPAAQAADQRGDTVAAQA
jgi:hypothetical protein